MSDNALVAANTHFAFKLFAELARQEKSANIFISPVSVALALAMTYNGAAGATERAMARALELDGMSLAEVNQANAELKASLDQSLANVELAIANSLWARRGISFSPEFMRRNVEFYGAEIVDLDFAAPGAADRINAWVRQQTNGKISKIIDRLQADAILFLLNAIYFKGDWTKPFDKARTRPEPFTLADGRQRPHPLMAQSARYRYLEDRDLQAVALPYADGRLSMYFFLPGERSGIEAFQGALSGASWDAWMRRFHDMEGSIAIPRFRLEYEIQLNHALQALGMGPAFDRQHANFSAMLAPGAPAPNVYIDEVKHKTFVDVNEQGTEAAAVTSVGMRVASFAPSRTFHMVVDRPFFCAIRDERSGVILFMGRITDPQSA